MQKNTVKLDFFDKETFSDIRTLPKVDNFIIDGKTSYPYFEHLSEDVFGTLFKHYWRFEKEIDPAVQFNASVVETLTSLPEYRDLLFKTRGDKFMAAMGLLALGPQILNFIPQDIKEQAKKIEKLTEQYNKILEKKSSSKEIEQKIKELRQAYEYFAKLTKNIDQGQLRQKLRKALDNVNTQIENYRQLAYGFSMGKDVNEMNKFNNLDSIFSLMQKLINNYQLKEIAKLAGRLKLSLFSKLKSTKHPYKEVVHSVEMGNNIFNLLPREYWYFMHLKVDFFYRYSQKKLLQYEFQGEQSKIKGPIVVCVDESGSMSERGAVPFIFAKALTMSLIELAKLEKRAVHIISFSSANMINEWNFADPSKISPSILLEIAEHNFGQNTDFNSPLERAFEILEQDTFKKADIVFVTDGRSVVQADIAKNINSLKKKKETRILAVGIFSQVETLNEIADKTYSFNFDTLDESFEAGNQVLDFEIEKK